jgi:hypothetical protein
MQNVGSSEYVEGFTVNKTTQNICNFQNTNITNMTTTFTIEQIPTVSVTAADMMIINFLLYKLCFEF